MTEKIIYLSVTALNKYIENKYKNDPYLKEMYIKGEISNCKLHSNGNFYFSIKDNYSKIDAIKFNDKSGDTYKEGDTVYIKASLNFFANFGVQKLNVNEIKKDDIGDLYKQLLISKEKLSLEGIFLDRHKKEIPKFPKNIGIITSVSGAAIQDIKRTIYRRYPLAQLNIYSSLVQGENAIEEIIKNVNIADNENNDVIILARGGGSIEDLWIFNNEEIVRTIFRCKTPIVTGVGHETDTTLVDYVADKRASTPTAAAEIVTPHTINELKNYINNSKIKLEQLLNEKISNNRKKISIIKNQYSVKNFINNINNNKKILDNYKYKLNNIINNTIKSNENKIINSKNKMKSLHILNKYVNAFNYKIEQLNSNSPLNILNKGYSFLSDPNDNKISSINNLKINDNIKITLTDGYVDAKVINIHKEEKRDAEK